MTNAARGMIGIVLGLAFCSLPLFVKFSPVGFWTAIGIGALGVLAGAATIVRDGWGGMALRLVLFGVLFLAFAIPAFMLSVQAIDGSRDWGTALAAWGFSALMLIPLIGTIMSGRRGVAAGPRPRSRRRPDDGRRPEPPGAL